MSQSIGIIWESSGTFGCRQWSSDYIPYVLEQLNRIARRLGLHELDNWILEDKEILEELLDTCAESLETASTLYVDSEGLVEFQRSTLKSMQDIERRLQRLETQTKWHNPSHALGTVRGLLIHLKGKPGTLFNDLVNETYLIEELERLEQLLTDAERDGIRFAFHIG